MSSRDTSACSADELLLSNGTDEALHLIADTFLDPGDSVLLVEPTFAMYRFYSELAGARIQALRYDANLRFPTAEVVRALRMRSAPKIFFVANPNNPTGNVLEPAQLRRIIQAAAKTIVVVDEAYFEYSGITILPWIRRHQNLVVTRTFSKAAGLAGLRIGCIFTARELAAGFRKAQSPYPVNIAALVAARAAVRDRTYMRHTFARIPPQPRRIATRPHTSGNPILSHRREFHPAESWRSRKVRGGVARAWRHVDSRSLVRFWRRGLRAHHVGTFAQTRRVLRQLKENL